MYPSGLENYCHVSFPEMPCLLSSMRSAFIIFRWAPKSLQKYEKPQTRRITRRNKQRLRMFKAPLACWMKILEIETRPKILKLKTMLRLIWKVSSLIQSHHYEVSKWAHFTLFQKDLLWHKEDKGRFLDGRASKDVHASSVVHFGHLNRHFHQATSSRRRETP